MTGLPPFSFFFLGGGGGGCLWGLLHCALIVVEAVRYAARKEVKTLFGKAERCIYDPYRYIYLDSSRRILLYLDVTMI